MRLVIRDLFCKKAYGIWIIEDRIIQGVRQSFVAKPCKLSFEERPECQAFPEPTFEIEDHHIHELITSGTMEIEMSGLGKQLTSTHKAEIDAMKYHLEDMRRLVFERNKI